MGDYTEQQREYREWLRDKQEHQAHIRRLLMAWVLINGAMVLALLSGILAYYLTVWVYVHR